MPRLEEILPLSGPMVDNIDSESLRSDQGLVRKRVNMRPDNIGNIFSNTPVDGTVKLTSPTLPTGTNKTIGWCPDVQNEAIIWFVYNSQGNHSIFRVFISTGEVQKIFYSQSTLGLTDNIVNAEVVEGRLYWNDNSQEPKSFNILKALNYTNNFSGEAYSSSDQPFDENIFPYIKKPPQFKPNVIYDSLTEHEGQTINFNNLRKKQWQVKYNYVYDDFHESTYSPISYVPLPEEDITSVGVWVTDITTNNALRITVSTGSNDVKSINIAIRDASNRNTDSFYKFITIEKFDTNGSSLISNNALYTVYFLNNTSLDSIDNAYGNAYFHDVPLSAKDLFLFDGKYIGMSMPKIGYDFEESQLDYDLSIVTADADFSSSSTTIPKTSNDSVVVITKCGSTQVKRTRVTFTIPSTFYANSVYQISVPRGDETVVAQYITPTTEPGDFPSIAKESLYNQLKNQIQECSPLPPMDVLNSGNNKVILDYWNLSGASTATGIITSASSVVYKGLKRGQYHKFGIVYNDGYSRYNIVFGDKEIYAPLPDAVASPANLQTVAKPKITINSRPPEWAKTYRIAYIPYNSYTYSLFVPVVEQILGTGVDGGNGIPTNKYFLKINQAITRIIKAFPNSQLSAYVWANGDRVRRWGHEDSYEVLDEYTRTYDDGGTDVTETGFIIDGGFDAIIGTSPPEIDNIEIYRPNLTPQDKVYYEIGEEFNILSPGEATRRHDAGVQPQSSDLATPAILEPDFGDIYYRERLSGDTSEPVVFVEDNNFSDYYASTGINIGRGVVKTKSEQKTSKQIKRSENFIENTELNRLNVFLSQRESYSVSDIYGDITKVIERGDTLKIIQEHRETSVYIGKNYAKQASGDEIVLETDKVFGSQLRYEAYLGSKYPRSVCASNDYVYFFDTITGDFCRSATNGTIEISSKYNMKEYFEAKAKAFREYIGTKDIVVAIEEETESVYISFIMGVSIETILFSEKEENKGFLFFVEFNNGSLIPENFAWHGDILYSFLNGEIYQHNTGNANSFYGSTRKEAYVDAVANSYPQVQKSYENITLDTDGQWTIEITSEKDNNYPFGQKTMIYPALLRNREGSLAGPILRNIIKRDGTEDINLLYSGNKISGHYININAKSVNFNNLREMKVVTINQK